MSDLIVIGGGFFGQAIAQTARAVGWLPTVVDDAMPNSGSRNAGGLMKSEWITKAEPGDIPYGLNLNVDWMRRLVTRPGEQFVNLRRVPEGVPWDIMRKYRRDLYVADPDKVLRLNLTTPGWVSRVQRAQGVSGWRVAFGTGSTLQAPMVVIAAGVWTDDLLRASGLPTVGVQGVRGRALLLRIPNYPVMNRYMPITFQTRPYHQLTLRAWNKPNLYHWGSTLETNPRQGEEAFERLVSLVSLFGSEAKIVGTLDGLRPHVPSGPVVRRIAPGLVVATGGHRLGLGLAGIAALWAIRLLGHEGVIRL